MHASLETCGAQSLLSHPEPGQLGIFSIWKGETTLLTGLFRVSAVSRLSKHCRQTFHRRGSLDAWYKHDGNELFRKSGKSLLWSQDNNTDASRHLEGCKATCSEASNFTAHTSCTCS